MSEFSRGENQLAPYEVLSAGSELLNHFDINVNPISQREQFLESIKQVDPRFQGDRNQVRWELEADQTEWPAFTKEIIMRAAENMRMLHYQTPLIGHYDAVIALGGARQSNLDRTRYAVECAKDQGYETTFKHLIVAGSGRKLNEQEQQATANYAPGAQTEFDLCVAAASVVAQENPGLITSVSYTDQERAGTPDIIETVLTSLQKSDQAIYGESTIAAITTQIYQVSTDMDLRRIAKNFGIPNIYVAGNPSDPEIIAKRTPATYLTEVIRTLRAASLAAEPVTGLAE
ncbi:hypothetical protein KW794_01145 [Candidatus Saccharibacteria bacterium]|nr:hypothetical protein [Candidatus Saccharibacteria bacterium]